VLNALHTVWARLTAPPICFSYPPTNRHLSAGCLLPCTGKRTRFPKAVGDYEQV